MSRPRKLIVRPELLGDDVFDPVEAQILGRGYRRVVRRASINLISGAMLATASYEHPDGSRVVVRVRKRAELP
jgi:hypothetical protein